MRGSFHYLEKKDDKVTILERQGTPRYKRNKCLYHEDANHWTNECKLYLSKAVQERRDTLKEKGACWSCLKRGHRTQDQNWANLFQDLCEMEKNSSHSMHQT